MTTLDSTRKSPRRKAVERSPAFQLYTKDLLSDANVLAMTLAEFGAYMKLLAICWNERGLPCDRMRLAKMLGVNDAEFAPIWDSIAHCFTQHGDTWQHPRLEKERKEQAKFRKQRQLAAQARWDRSNGPRNARALHPQSPSSASASASSPAVCVQPARVEEPPPPRESAVPSQPSSSLSERAGDFSEWYGQTHARIIGVGYIGSRRDYEAALRLVEIFSDQQIRDAAIVWFGMDDDFATHGTRTVPKFASRASACVELLQKRGIA